MPKKKVDMTQLFSELKSEYEIDFNSIITFAMNFISIASIEKLKEIREGLPDEQKNAPGMFAHRANINDEVVTIQVFIGEPPEELIADMDIPPEVGTVH